MNWINMKHNYILPHFIQFKKSFFYRASLVAASGHLHYFVSLLFLTFPISPFRRNHLKCSIKKAVFKVLNIHVKPPMIESLFKKVQGWRAVTLLLNRDSNTGVFLWIFLFTNSYRITCFPFCIEIFSENDYNRKNITPIKIAGASSWIKGRVSGEFWWWTTRR